MYISLKWVQNITGLKHLSLAVLSERLTLAGFEIEETVQKLTLSEIDFILDVSLTANRSDIFNIKGFAKELLSIFFQEKEQFYVKSPPLNPVKFSMLNENPIQIQCKPFVWENFIQKKLFYQNKKNKVNLPVFEACSSFFFIESNNLNVNSGPKWLQKYLLSSNVNPINNVLDTINFVTLETGYPFFACDLNKLKKYVNTATFSFSTRYASAQQTFQVDSDRIISLQPNNLLLYLNEKPISILGLLTLKEIEIDETTTNILIYGGLFDPVQIRKSSQSLGIRTEQSVSLEKNLNFNGLEQAFIRLIILFNVQHITFTKDDLPTIHRIDTLKKTSFINYVENKRPLLKLSYKEVRNLLGSSLLLERGKIVTILKALYFHIIQETSDGCELYIPFSREFDIEREVDIIEEIVRISGFTSFLSIVPHYQKVGKFSKLEKLKRLLRKSLIELGFNEVLHYSISTLQSSNQLELKNPIVPESSYFRINLLHQLIQKAGINRKQKNNILEAFEIGRGYSVLNGNIVESELISGIFGGNLYRSYWNEEGKPINWFEAKGLMEHLFDLLGISVMWGKSVNKNMNFLHPGRYGQLFINNQRFGIFGQIHPKIAKTNLLINETYVFEFNLEILKTLWQAKQLYTYKPYSLFPASLVDLACIKNDSIAFKEVETKIWEIGGPLLESINLFDYYSGLPIPSGYHSLGFKLKFRNFDRTLTNEEVDSIVKKITNSLEKDFDIKMRK